MTNNPIMHFSYTYRVYFLILRVGVNASSLHTNFQKKTHTVMCERSVEFVNAEEMHLHHLLTIARPQGQDKISLSVFSLVLMKNSEDLEKARKPTKTSFLIFSAVLLSFKHYLEVRFTSMYMLILTTKTIIICDVILIF